METSVVKSNEFEKLLEKIRVERVIVQNSELNIERRFGILKAISSVYFFLRVALEMPYRGISLEEFEIAEARLQLIAQKKAKKFWNRFWKALGGTTWWNYYLASGHFQDRNKKTVIGPWKGYPNSYWEFKDEYGKINDTYSPKLVPPNASELLEAIFEKKYGTPLDRKS